jgi:hypothetical protein
MIHHYPLSEPSLLPQILLIWLGSAPVLPTTVLANQQQLEAHLQLALQANTGLNESRHARYMYFCYISGTFHAVVCDIF